MITLKAKGDFRKTRTFFNFLYKREFIKNLEECAAEGLVALMDATPVDTGTTKNSWYYTIEYRRNKILITWYNSNNVDGVPVVILLQYGHATEWGKYVTGLDFINPALQPIFDKIINDMWEEVQKR